MLDRPTGETVADTIDYPTLAAGCRTENEFNRLHIDLENILAPAEIAELAKLAAGAAKPRTAKSVLLNKHELDAEALAARKRGSLPGWIKRLRKLSPGIAESPQTYRRYEFGKHITLYRDPEVETKGKDLLIAFTGAGRRLLMPIAIFLQCLRSSSWDAVVLKRCARNSFLRGIEGVADDLPGLARFIEAAMPTKDYRRTITLGTCGGGYAAVCAALEMRADRGLSICGTLPWQATDYRPPQPVAGVELVLVYGGEHARDAQFSADLAGVLGGRFTPFPAWISTACSACCLGKGRSPAFLARFSLEGRGPLGR